MNEELRDDDEIESAAALLFSLILWPISFVTYFTTDRWVVCFGFQCAAVAMMLLIPAVNVLTNKVNWPEVKRNIIFFACVLGGFLFAGGIGHLIDDPSIRRRAITSISSVAIVASYLLAFWGMHMPTLRQFLDLFVKGLQGVSDSQRSRSQVQGTRGFAVVIGSGFLPPTEMIDSLNAEGKLGGCPVCTTWQDPIGWNDDKAYVGKAEATAARAASEKGLKFRDFNREVVFLRFPKNGQKVCVVRLT